jgi:hypothetical protein
MPERSFSFLHIVRNSVLIISWIWYIVFTRLLNASDNLAAPVDAAIESGSSRLIVSTTSTSSRPETPQIDLISPTHVNLENHQDQIVMMPVEMPDEDEKRHDIQNPSLMDDDARPNGEDQPISSIPEPSTMATSPAYIEWPYDIKNTNTVYITIRLTRTETVTLYRPRAKKTIETDAPEATEWSDERELKV